MKLEFSELKKVSEILRFFGCISLSSLSEQTGLSTIKAKKSLDVLIGLGLVRKEKVQGEENFIAEPTVKFTPPERRFAVFIDIKNLEDGISNAAERFKDFSWLLDPILKEGKIAFAFVFAPEHKAMLTPVMQLSYLHGFYVVICPRQVGAMAVKDADSVDEKMKDLARTIIDRSDVTDIVIVSGDADFHPLALYAKRQRKNVIIKSAASALSSRYADSQIRVEKI